MLAVSPTASCSRIVHCPGCSKTTGPRVSTSGKRGESVLVGRDDSTHRTRLTPKGLFFCADYVGECSPLSPRAEIGSRREPATLRLRRSMPSRITQPWFADLPALGGRITHGMLITVSSSLPHRIERKLMPDRIIIQCPGCSAKLAISDASKLGKKIKCSKCSEVFVAKAAARGGTKAKPMKSAPAAKPKKSDDDDEFNFEDMEMEDKSAAEDEESEDETPVRKSKAGGKKATVKGKGKGKGKANSGGNKLPLIIGGSAAVLLLVAVGVYFMFFGQKPPAPAAPVQPADSPNDKILALKWLPQDSELIIHLKIADVWQAPLLKGLLAAPQVAGGVAQIQQMTGLTPGDLESVTIGVRNVQQLQGAASMMASGGPPPTDAALLAVVRSKKPVEVLKIQQLIVQSVPGQAAKLLDRNGKQYIELVPPSSGTAPNPGLGPGQSLGPPSGAGGGGKPMGAWFADASTLILGPREELFGAMDRGETVTPRTEYRVVDASSHLLFVVAPKDPKLFSTPSGVPVGAPPGSLPGAPPTSTAPPQQEVQRIIQETLLAGSFGVSVTGGVALQSSLVCKDSAGASKLKPELEKQIAIGKSQFAAQKGTMPPFAAELLEMLVNSVQVTEQGQSVRVVANIPDSAQQKLEQLPTMLMGMAAFGGSPFGRGGNSLASAQNAAGEAQARNNLKQIGLAMHNYNDATGSFPPAFSADAQGKPLLSWRVHILPFLGEAELHKQFHVNEPWDSEHNMTLVSKMPAVFASSDDLELTSQGQTRLVVPTGAGMAFEGKDGIKIRDFLDGTGNTFIAVEVAADAAVTWTQPDDLAIDVNEPFRNLGGSRGDHFLAAFVDGSVRSIKDSIAADTLKALFTRKSGEILPPDVLR